MGKEKAHINLVVIGHVGECLAVLPADAAAANHGLRRAGKI
jgi:hypothetical protein